MVSANDKSGTAYVPPPVDWFVTTPVENEPDDTNPEYDDD